MAPGSVLGSLDLEDLATRRSMLPQRGQREAPAVEAAWTYLFTVYAPAMERYVARLLGRLGRAGAGAEASDIVQTWFHEALAKDWLDRDLHEIRCFRAWLRTQLQRLVWRHVETSHAQKRDPGAWAPPEALDGVAVADAEAALDDGLVRVAVERALCTMRASNEEYAEVVADLLRTDGEGSADLGARLGRSSAQLVHLRHRARKRFATLFHECLRETVRDDAAYTDLLRQLAPWMP